MWQLRPDRIKIDRELVFAAETDVLDESPLVKAIGEMGKALNIKMTAEGIENEMQATVLERAGCVIFQGYLFSPTLKYSKIQRSDTLANIAEHTNAMAATNGGFCVYSYDQGTAGDPAGIAFIDGQLVSEAVQNRPALLINRSAIKAFYNIAKRDD